MRLYLSSKRLGADPSKLRELISPHKLHAGVILNAGDTVQPEQREARFARVASRFDEIGITTEEIDLRNYFGERKISEADLLQFGLIWVQGGNIFILRRAYEQSGFDKCIVNLLNNDQIAYGGESAGAVILGNTLEGLDEVDDRDILPEGYKLKLPETGLGIIDYTIVPHFQSDHPESQSVIKLLTYLEAHNMPHKILRDGEVIIYS